MKALIARPRLGQGLDFTSGLTSGLAKQIVGEAEPVVRRIVRDERNRIAEALIGGIPFAGGAAMGYVATRYFVPGSKPGFKAVGYIASAATAAIGAWWTFKRLTETSAVPEGETPAGTPPKIVSKSAAALVQEAEPRVRKIVDDEKALMAKSFETGIPWAMGSAAVFLATMFIPKSDKVVLKAGGYTLSTLLLGVGTWRILEATRESVQ